LDQLVVFVLQSQGGGELSLYVPGTRAHVNVEGNRFEDGTGASARYGSQNVTDENLRRVAEVCREALRKRYPDLR